MVSQGYKQSKEAAQGGFLMWPIGRKIYNWIAIGEYKNNGFVVAPLYLKDFLFNIRWNIMVLMGKLVFYVENSRNKRETF